jgi:hypothetical protein
MSQNVIPERKENINLQCKLELGLCHSSGFLQQMSGSVHMGFVMDEVALGQDFFGVLQFFPVSTFPSLLHTYAFVICGINKGPIEAQFDTCLTPSQQ